jgi:hypothetical protein
MENKKTDGNVAQSAAPITDLVNSPITDEIPFDISDLGTKIKPSLEDEKKEVKENTEIDVKSIVDGKTNIGNETTSTPTFLEFEGSKFELDKEGNALNPDGTIFKTKEEIDLPKEDDTLIVPTLIEDIIKLNGVTILDEIGNPKIYPDTEQGILDYAVDFAKHEVAQSQKEFFEQYPSVKEFAQHIAKGGKEEDFYKTKTASWKNIAIEEDNENQLIDLITKDLMSKGHSKEDATEMVTLFKDSNKLIEKGKASLDNLRKQEAVKEKQKLVNEAESTKQFEIQVEKHWSNVAEVIKNGKLKDITIPESDKEIFKRYIGVAVDKNGNSQRDLDERQASLEFNLQLDYLRMKKFDMSTLIKNAVNTQKAAELRSRLKKDSADNTNNGGGAKPVEKVNPNTIDISLNTLI